MTRRTTTGRTVAGLLALVLALIATTAACGDPLADKLESSGRQPYSDEDPPLVDPEATTTTAAQDPAALAKWAFVSEANRICIERRQVGATSFDGRPAQTPEALVDQMEAIQQTYRAVADLIGRLTPPPGEEAIVADLLGGFNHMLVHMESFPPGARFSDQAAAEAWLAELDLRETSLRDRLIAYGISDCTS